MKEYCIIFISQSKIALLRQTQCREYEFVSNHDLYSLFDSYNNTRYVESVKSIMRLLITSKNHTIKCLNIYDDLTPQQKIILHELEVALLHHGVNMNVVYKGKMKFTEGGGEI